MSRESGSEHTQRTVAELLAQYGGQRRECATSATPPRGRRGRRPAAGHRAPDDHRAGPVRQRPADGRCATTTAAPSRVVAPLPNRRPRRAHRVPAETAGRAAAAATAAAAMPLPQQLPQVRDRSAAAEPSPPDPGPPPGAGAARRRRADPAGAAGPRPAVASGHAAPTCPSDMPARPRAGSAEAGRGRTRHGSTPRRRPVAHEHRPPAEAGCRRRCRCRCPARRARR